MSDDLKELRERVQFARDETTALDGLVRDFCNKNIQFVQQPQGWAVFVKPGSNTVYDLYAVQQAAVPTPIGSKAGMIANELRSCLDGLACTLATRNNKSTSGTYFPVSKSEAIFKEDGMQKIRKLSQADKDRIIDLKPFREGDPILFGLHEADRTRKHTRLTGLTGGQPQANIAGMFNLVNCSNFQIQDAMFNDVYVHNLTFHGFRQIPRLNEKVLLASGVPARLPMRVECALAYS